MDIFGWLGLALLAAVFLLGAFALFKDSMNLFQKVGRLYWITRNNTEREQPFMSRAFLAHDSPPYWEGKGIQIAIKYGERSAYDYYADEEWMRPRQWTFQVGILTGQAKKFNPDLYQNDSRLRDWHRPSK